MLEKLKNTKREEEGFTLMELLVVILIIGILAAIAIPVFLNQRKAAVDSSVESDVKNAATAAETWAVSKGNVKTNITLEDLMNEGLKLSSADTKMSVIGSNTGGYCITGYNPNGDQYTNPIQVATYDSNAGGLNRTGENCAGGISNDGGNGIDLPKGVKVQMTKDGNTETFEATAVWNSYGGVDILAEGQAVNGDSTGGNVTYYCNGVGNANTDFMYGSYMDGIFSLTSYNAPRDCEIDGISFSTYEEFQPWINVTESAIIPVVGQRPAAPAETPGDNGGEWNECEMTNSCDAVIEVFDFSQTIPLPHYSGQDYYDGTVDMNIYRGDDNQVSISGQIHKTGPGWNEEYAQDFTLKGNLYLQFSQFDVNIQVNPDGFFSYNGDGSNIYEVNKVSILFNLENDDVTSLSGYYEK